MFEAEAVILELDGDRLDRHRPSTDARVEFDAFFRRNHRSLARLAYTLTGNSADADELAGEALALAWQFWWRVRAADVPLAYVRRIIINLVADRARSAIRERRRLVLLGPLIGWQQSDVHLGTAVDLQAAIVALPPGRRACVVLRHVFDLPAEEVAQTLGISLGTVKSQTAKGLAQMRTMLIDAGDIDEVSRAIKGPSTSGNRRSRRHDG